MAGVNPQPPSKIGAPQPGPVQDGAGEAKKDENVKKNIFAMPLEKQKRGKQEMKKKNFTRSYIYLGIAVLLILPYSILFVYPQVNDYLSFNKNKQAIEDKIEEVKTTISDKEETRDFHKAAYEKDYASEVTVIDTVFPETPEKLEVVRLMEDFATYLDTTYGDFEFTSISFEAPKVISEKVKVKNEETDKEKVVDMKYTVLPFSTSIHASQKNFDRFLAFVDLSGDADVNSDDHIRLMEITNVSINYRGADKTGKDLGVDFSVKLNAYSR